MIREGLRKEGSADLPLGLLAFRMRLPRPSPSRLCYACTLLLCGCVASETACSMPRFSLGRLNAKFERGTWATPANVRRRDLGHGPRTPTGRPGLPEKRATAWATVDDAAGPPGLWAISRAAPAAAVRRGPLPSAGPPGPRRRQPRAAPRPRPSRRCRCG